MKKLKYIIFAFLIIRCSPNQKVDIDKVEKAIGTELNYNYKIVNYDYDVGIGNSLEIFEIKFVKSDFEDLLSRIDLNAFEKYQNNYYKFIEYGESRVSLVINIKKETIKYSNHDL